MVKDNRIALIYSFITLILTFIVGQILLLLYPNGNTIGSSILFILINLLPMIVAIVFSKYEKKKKVLKDMFFRREKITSYILVMCCVFYIMEYLLYWEIFNIQVGQF